MKRPQLFVVRRPAFTTLFFFAIVLSLGRQAAAEIIIPPPDLRPADQYRLIFLTSGIRDATSTDIEDYNAFVQQHANASPELAALGVEWKAAASTATRSSTQGVKK